MISKKAQPSRKGKKAWRKNVDITKIEEGLSEINEELRTTGEKLHKVSDSSLFSIDKSGDTQLKKKLKSKPLKYQQILTPDSSVPMLLSRCHPVSSNVREMIYGKKKRIISRTTLKSIQKAVEKLEKNKKIFSVKNTSASHNKHKKNGVDIWGENAVPKVAPENEFIDEIIKPFKKKKPALPETRSKHVESVKLAENGQSYNPSFKEHQVTLQEAVDEELRIADLNNKLEELVSFPSELNELNEEMDVDVSGDEIEEDNMEEDDNNFAKVVLSESRKTRAQRNKEQRKIAKEREEKKIKDAKELALQVSNIKEINNAVNSTLNMEKSVTVKESSQMRLGPHKFKSIPKALDVTLTEDLADSLRIIKPEGNIFTERFNSLQERGLIEPRVPVGKKRKFKKKVIEVHSYKRFK